MDQYRIDEFTEGVVMAKRTAQEHLLEYAIPEALENYDDSHYLALHTFLACARDHEGTAVLLRRGEAKKMLDAGGPDVYQKGKYSTKDEFRKFLESLQVSAEVTTPGGDTTLVSPLHFVRM